MIAAALDLTLQERLMAATARGVVLAWCRHVTPAGDAYTVTTAASTRTYTASELAELLDTRRSERTPARAAHS